MSHEAVYFSLFNNQIKPNTLSELEIHTFPDKESLITIKSDVEGKTVHLLANLAHPNDKILPLVFISETLKSLGAKKIILIAPYLPYMRQDKAFQEGQGINAIYFAKLISNYFDGLITVDPHLHRISNLETIYTIPTKTYHATMPIALFIKKHYKNPIIIGPDEESRQWVKAIASQIQCDYVVLKKIRKGDKNVEIAPIDYIFKADQAPIIIDDVVSSGRTLIEVIKKIPIKPICIVVHALLNHKTYETIQSITTEFISCNSIPHESNQIDLTNLIFS